MAESPDADGATERPRGSSHAFRCWPLRSALRDHGRAHEGLQSGRSGRLNVGLKARVNVRRWPNQFDEGAAVRMLGFSIAAFRRFVRTRTSGQEEAFPFTSAQTSGCRIHAGNRHSDHLFLGCSDCLKQVSPRLRKLFIGAESRCQTSSAMKYQSATVTSTTSASSIFRACAGLGERLCWPPAGDTSATGLYSGLELQPGGI